MADLGNYKLYKLPNELLAWVIILSTVCKLFNEWLAGISF